MQNVLQGKQLGDGRSAVLAAASGMTAGECCDTGQKQAVHQLDEECDNSAVLAAVSVMMAEKSGDTSSDGVGSDGEWLKGLTCVTETEACAGRIMEKDDALAAVLIKEGWGPLPGL